MLDDSKMIVKPTEYQHFHEIINVDQKTLIGTVMVKAMKYSEFHENVNVEHQNGDGKSNEILRFLSHLDRIN